MRCNRASTVHLTAEALPKPGPCRRRIGAATSRSGQQPIPIRDRAVKSDRPYPPSPWRCRLVPSPDRVSFRRPPESLVQLRERVICGSMCRVLGVPCRFFRLGRSGRLVRGRIRWRQVSRAVFKWVLPDRDCSPNAIRSSRHPVQTDCPPGWATMALRADSPLSQRPDRLVPQQKVLPSAFRSLWKHKLEAAVRDRGHRQE